MAKSNKKDQDAAASTPAKKDGATTPPVVDQGNAATAPAKDGDKLKKAAAQAFKDNPNTDELHLCADGMPFYRESDARNHARDLAPDQREVVRFTRKDA